MGEGGRGESSATIVVFDTLLSFGKLVGYFEVSFYEQAFRTRWEILVAVNWTGRGLDSTIWCAPLLSAKGMDRQGVIIFLCGPESVQRGR